jgi:hypothetical protein
VAGDHQTTLVNGCPAVFDVIQQTTARRSGPFGTGGLRRLRERDDHRVVPAEAAAKLRRMMAAMVVSLDVV